MDCPHNNPLLLFSIQPNTGEIPPSDVVLFLLQSDIGFGKLETYVKLDKLGEVRRC